MRQTAVPGFVSLPIASHTKRYFPPAEDCVRNTVTVGRLQDTRVASRSRPASSTITSGVRSTHQFGGSTFVTTEVFSAAATCPDPACPSPAIAAEENKLSSNAGRNTRTRKRGDISNFVDGSSTQQA